MTEVILRALMQAGRAINNPFSMNSGYVLPRHGDARADLGKVLGDMRTIGNDMKKVADQEAKRHGR